MKRHKHLFEAVSSFENLLAASRKARLGKRFKGPVAAFEYALEPELLGLQAELLSGAYRPGTYRSFWITDPKPRLISAAPYRDRVVHHALCRVIEPVFERTFIHDSYACRQGKGTHSAIERFQSFARRSPYVLKCDIAKYFPSIDHEILYEAIARKIGCRRTLDLIRRIIDNSNEQEPSVHYFPGDNLFTPFERRRGIPIGNLTSQFFANIYLNGFDHFVKQGLRCRGYVRYVDDFALFGDSKAALWDAAREVEAFLAGCRLRLHPRKCHVRRTADGAEFLGFRVFPTRRVPLKQKSRQYLRRLRKLSKEYADGQVSVEKVRQSVVSWIGHVSFGASAGLRASVLSQVCFTKGRTVRPRVAGRFLEQQPEELPFGQPQQEQSGEPEQQQRVSVDLSRLSSLNQTVGAGALRGASGEPLKV
jgi:RNA-directed DNA polymerase